MAALEFVKFAFMYGMRSLARNRRRSLFLYATVALAGLTSIVANSYASAVFRFWIASTTETGPGHAQVHKIGYWTESNGLEHKHCLENGNPIERDLIEDKDVQGVSRRILIEGLVSAGTKSIYFSGYGIDPQEEVVVSPRLVKFQGSVGKFVDPEDPGGVVVGKGMADTLGLSLGDVVTLSVQTVPENGQGAINAKDVVVAGIIDFPQSMISKRIIYMNLLLARQIMQVDGLYSEMALRLKPGVDLEAWSAAKKTEMQRLGAELRPWWEIYPPMKKIEDIFRKVVGVICLLLFLSAGISVLNIVFLTIAERTVEMGILMSIGAKGRDVRRMLGLEAVVVGVVGGGLGLVLGNVAVLVMNIFGMPLPNPLFRGFVYIRPEFDPVFSVVVFAFGLSICWLSTILPARRASRVEPVVAFRGQI